MKLIIASNNKNKIGEIKEILGEFFSEMMSLKEAEIDIDVVEDGDTFEQNAMKKATEIAALVPNVAVLADDSGLCVEAIGGEPGVYSARYSGKGHDDKANNQKLLENLAGVQDKDRSAYFISSIVLLRPGLKPVCINGYCHGHIGYEEIGHNGFGYDPIFYIDGIDKSFAQLTSEEKNTISHRANSLKELKNVLNKE